MSGLRRRLWPRDRLAIALLLYAIWIPLIVVAINYVEDSTGSNATVEVSSEGEGPADFAETVGWTWGVLWVGYAALAAWLARIKGRDPVRWGLASLLTFVALFPFLAVAPERGRGEARG